MTKKKVGIYWRLCWGILMPALLIIIFIYFIVNLKPLTYGIYELEYPVGLTGKYKYIKLIKTYNVGYVTVLN